MRTFKKFLRENEEHEDEEPLPWSHEPGGEPDSVRDIYGKYWKSKEEADVYYKKVEEYDKWARGEFEKGHSIDSIKKISKDHKIPDHIINNNARYLNRLSREKNLVNWARGELEKGHSFDSILKTMADTSESKGDPRSEAFFLGNYMLNHLSSSEEESVEKITSWLLAEREKGFKEDDLVSLARKHKVKELILWCAVMQAYHKSRRGGPSFKYKLYLL
jgi:hypothetical protein